MLVALNSAAVELIGDLDSVRLHSFIRGRTLLCVTFFQINDCVSTLISICLYASVEPSDEAVVQSANVLLEVIKKACERMLPRSVVSRYFSITLNNRVSGESKRCSSFS